MNYIRLISLFLIIPFIGSAQVEDWRNHFFYFNDFVAHVNADVVGRDMYASNTGSGAGTTSTVPSADRSVIGVARVTTGTTTTGRACITTGQNIFTFGNGAWVFETRIDSIENLSSVGERYSFGIGFIDNNTSNVMTDAAMFLYDEGGVTTGSTASANWQCVTASNSSRTYTTSSIAVATTGQTLRIDVAPDASEVVFYVDGVEAARHATNIPSTILTRVFGFGYVLLKSAGTTARTVDIDYIMAECRYNTPK